MVGKADKLIHAIGLLRSIIHRIDFLDRRGERFAAPAGLNLLFELFTPPRPGTGIERLGVWFIEYTIDTLARSIETLNYGTNLVITSVTVAESRSDRFHFTPFASIHSQIRVLPV
jgi:hypothetical protein